MNASNAESYVINKAELNVILTNANSSFSFPFIFQLRHSLTNIKSRQYSIEVYSQNTNLIYIFLNTEEKKFQCALFAQISPPKPQSFIEVIIKINNNSYTVKLNCIDSHRSKFNSHLINIPLNFIFEEPKVFYAVNEEDLNNENRFKICLYYLSDSKYHITCHAYQKYSFPQSLLKRINEMDQVKILSEYRELQYKVEISLEKHKNNKSLENMQKLMNEIQILYNNEIKKDNIFRYIYLTY